MRDLDIQVIGNISNINVIDTVIINGDATIVKGKSIVNVGKDITVNAESDGRITCKRVIKS